jgi:CRP-like cAMP-binding protein
MALEKEIRRLSAIPILAELDLEALRLIAFSAETRIFRAGDLVVRKGDRSMGAFVIVSGLVHVESENGVKELGPQSLLGEMALLTETECTADAVARQPTVLTFIARQLFHRVLKEFPDSAARLQALIESRLNSFRVSAGLS